MSATNTLVTFLGKGRADQQDGYKTATYRFPDDSEKTTPFFGLALADYLAVDTLVILGTSGSQWSVLVEKLAREGEEEDKRIRLMDAESEDRVDQTMLNDLADVMGRAAGRTVLPRLIPFGKNADEQYRILETVAAAVPNGTVNFDVTHGFRHLGMVGLLSAFMLERVRNLRVDRLWYGALDMTDRTTHITPVLRLEGLRRVQRWIDALDRFDATGDYGVFAPLLEADGVPRKKVESLKRAAFYERNFNLKDAADSLRIFSTTLAEDLPGASGLFQHRLSERLVWIKEPNLAAQQRKLAFQYLKRGDFVRAAVFGWEAYITFECEAHRRDPNDFTDSGRKGMIEELRSEQGKFPDWKRKAYRELNALRNALAHSAVPEDVSLRRVLRDEPQLKQTLERSIQQLVPTAVEMKAHLTERQ